VTSAPRAPEASVDGRTRRRLETRERVRQAAFELFVRDGFERTTTSAIAKRAGVAAGTIFLHAPDKADLLFLVMHDRLEAVVEARARDLPDGPLLDRLMHLFDGLFRMYGEYPGLAADFVRHLPGADGPNARRVSTLTLAFLHRLAMLVVDAQRRGEVARDVDLLTCSRNLFGLYFVALLTWLSGQVTLEGALVPTLRDSLALQIRGLRA
jgi:AcrR family transcriptional regulator